MDRCFEFAEAVSQRFDIPFVLMTYYNILFKFGVAEFADRMAAAGLRGAPRKPAAAMRSANSATPNLNRML